MRRTRNVDISHLKTFIGDDNFFMSGSDEVGRGPLAGPVVAATVCIDVEGSWQFEEVRNFLKKLTRWGVRDSKKLKERERRAILNKIGLEVHELKKRSVFEIFCTESVTIKFSISEISPSKIDEINIFNASLTAMKDSLEFTLRCHKHVKKGLMLIDGKHVPRNLSSEVRAEAIVGGDEKSVLIGLASVIAKEYRDHYMAKIAKRYPGYGLEKHVGYGTVFHRNAISRLGVTDIHRKTFKGVKEFITEEE